MLAQYSIEEAMGTAGSASLGDSTSAGMGDPLRQRLVPVWGYPELSLSGRETHSALSLWRRDSVASA